METQRHPGIRPAKKAGMWEATISSPLLQRGRAHRNLPSFEAAVAYKERMERALNELGVIPEELTRKGIRSTTRTGKPVRPLKVAAPEATAKRASESPELSKLVRMYLDSDTAKIAKSGVETLVALEGELKGRLDGVTTHWVDDWVRHMKRVQRLAPGTIRKKVEALARAVDWWMRSKYPDGKSPPNVLRMLPIGYSSYGDGDVPPNTQAPRDVKRERRLHPGEDELLQEVLQGKHLGGKERPYARDGDADLLMLYRLIVNTGLRLREAFSLRREHVMFRFRTIHIEGSKTGASRDVPMTKQLADWLTEYMGITDATSNYTDGKRYEPVFPYWSGTVDEEVLREVGNRLSRRFATLFRHCGCDDLREHDLRHEATCRWVEKRKPDGSWMFRGEEVMKITGHKNAQMFLRYLSLRGSDLAAQLD